MAKKITGWSAAEIIGVSDRTMRRWRERLDEHGYSGLADRPLRRSSDKRVPLAQVEMVLRLYPETYYDLNMRHFHEKLREKHDIHLSYTWVQKALQGAGLVARRGKRGKHRSRREPRPMTGMLLHIDGSKHQWFGDAQTLAQPEAFDFLALLDERYSSVRKFAPLLLAHFEFHGAPAAAELLKALDLLRDLNASGKRTLPEHVPAGFVKPRWQPHVFPPSGVDRRFYELCALAELRDRLRAGDIWVTGSRQYRDFETYLIPAVTFKAMQKEPLPLDIDTDLPSYLAECRQRLEDTLTTVASKAREQTLPDVTLADGKLRITPLRKNTPESAEAFAEKAYALMPHVKITELLAEVDQWTSMGDRFVHLRTQAPPKNRQALLTAVLADGINLGLTRMAEACHESSWRQLCWTADWHVREACYAQALAGLIDAQHSQPFAAHWGSGTTSSSDAQFFRAGGRGEVGGLVNLHYGQDPGVKFYTHLSDQFGPFHTKVIAATANEAPHVLDGLLYHQSSLVINEHYTDTGGFSDHVFAMCRLLGFRFAPRIRDLKEKRL